MICFGVFTQHRPIADIRFYGQLPVPIPCIPPKQDLLAVVSKRLPFGFAHEVTEKSEGVCKHGLRRRGPFSLRARLLHHRVFPGMRALLTHQFQPK